MTEKSNFSFLRYSVRRVDDEEDEEKVEHGCCYQQMQRSQIRVDQRHAEQ